MIIMTDPQKLCDVHLQCTEIFSHVADHPFVVFYLSGESQPRTITLNKHMKSIQSFKVRKNCDTLALVGQMYYKRQNDEDKTVSQYLGSVVVDLSMVSDKEYSFVVKDSSSRPPIKTGQISMKLTVEKDQWNPMKIQSRTFSREMYSAADANLTWIDGFSPKGLPSIVPGLHYVHSPYYVNHVGVTMPSGAFCMIPTTLEDNFTKAVKSHKQRMLIALSRNCMRQKHWESTVDDLFSSTIKSKHLRCLAVVADLLTLHARMEINYTPDVQVTPKLIGTERWSIPREPSEDGDIAFNGDCEDFAREVYQQCKEIREWIKPESKTMLGKLSMILHMYIPTIEQGAVDSQAHSKYITYDAAYRNHIWAALHPRQSWKTKMHANGGKELLETLYEQFPFQKCENTLPLLHLEGTGDVYPVVTNRKPGYIVKMKRKSTQIANEWPFVRDTETPDMSLQCDHHSTFYKYAIAFMTDIFKEKGLLDYTYVTDRKYGVNIYNWARGKYTFVPSTQHSQETMENIQEMIRLERPIRAITTTSTIVKKPLASTGYYLRFGSRTPINSDYENIAEYKIGTHSWYEAYFKVDNSQGSASEIGSASEVELKN